MALGGFPWILARIVRLGYSLVHYCLAICFLNGQKCMVAGSLKMNGIPGSSRCVKNLPFVVFFSSEKTQIVHIGKMQVYLGLSHLPSNRFQNQGLVRSPEPKHVFVSSHTGDYSWEQGIPHLDLHKMLGKSGEEWWFTMAESVKSHQLNKSKPNTSDSGETSGNVLQVNVGV